MACAHLNAAIVQRSKGGSAVGAAAYAARVRMVDAKTGRVFDYSADRDDVMFSGVFLPKGAPEHLRDLAAFSNAMEAREKRRDAQTARKFIIALPHELTPEQREWLVKDIGRENFTRKGLGFHVAIHRPHTYGDERNFHAHFTVGMRTMDATGFTEKHLESNSKEALYGWRKSVEKLTNRHLERHGHAARISLKSLEEQGIDRMPQIHLGQAAAAQERKGVQTERGDRLREIINDNERLRVVMNEPKRTVGQEFDYAAGRDFAREVIGPQRPPAPRKPVQQPQDWTAGKLFAREDVGPPQRAASNDNRPETIDRDAEAAKSQDAIDNAGIAYAEERRQALLQVQAAERATSERHGVEMTARHGATWGEAVHRHAVEMAEAHSVAPASYQPGTMAEAEQAVSFGLAFVVGVASSVLDSALSLVSPSRRATRQRSAPEKPKKREASRQEQQKRDQHQQEMSAIAAEQTRERESYERRRAAMLQDQQRARDHFERNYAEPSALQQAFDIHGRYVDSYRAEMERMAAQKEAREQQQERDGPEFEGPELQP